MKIMIFVTIFVSALPVVFQHPGESPTYTFHEDQTYNTRERSSVNFVQLLYISEKHDMYHAAC